MQEVNGEARFTDLLRQSIVAALNSALGKSSADRILGYLRLDTSENMLEISDLLRSCCGRSVASWVESSIVRRLCERTRLDWDKICAFEFEESMALAHEAFAGDEGLQEKGLLLRP